MSGAKGAAISMQEQSIEQPESSHEQRMRLKLRSSLISAARQPYSAAPQP